MPAGLQVWDANGRLIVDSGTFGGRVLGSFDASADSGAFTDVRLSGQRVFAFPLPTLVSTTAYALGAQASPYIPRLTVSGATISWQRGTFVYENRGTCIVFYGVY